MNVQTIETAPKDGPIGAPTIMLKGKLGWLSPCIWSKAGDISEDGFWLWWQADPEYLTEVKNPTHWCYPPRLEKEGSDAL